MTNHQLATYSDGFVLVYYCSVCSAEGDKLLNKCGQKVPSLTPLDTRQKDLDNRRDWLDDDHS